MGKALYCLCVFFLSACDSSEVIQTGPPLTTGSFIGFAQYKEYYQYVTDYSGTTVELEGTDLKATTDALGRWEILNVPQDTYTVRITRPGFYLFRSFNNAIFPNGVNYFILNEKDRSTPRLERIPTYLSAVDLILDSMYDDKASNFKLTCHLKGENPEFLENQYIWIAIFLDVDSTMDPTDEGTYKSIMHLGSQKIVYEDQPLTVTIPAYKAYLLGAGGFHPGDTVYCVGYLRQAGVDDFYYYDPVLKKYPILGYSPNHTEIKRFVMPE